LNFLIFAKKSSNLISGYNISTTTIKVRGIREGTGIKQQIVDVGQDIE
jgi:hypothetical protein